MRSLTTSLFAFSLLSPGLCAQRALLVTPDTAETTRSGSNGTSLATLHHNALAVVTPNAIAAYSAEVYARPSTLQTLAGDDDGDGDVYTPDFTGGIDAILVTPWDFDPQLGYRPRLLPVTVESVYFSPRQDLGTFVSGAPGLRKGDCGRFVRTPAGNGRVEHFIKAEQIIAALGMYDPVTNQPLTPADIDLDGITVSQDRDIFLTFAADHSLRLRVGPGAGALVNFFLQDGGIAVIPGSAWLPSTTGVVGAVTAQRGLIALGEADVNVLLVNAAATNNAGMCVGLAGDTRDLGVDFDGGTFAINWGGQVLTFRDLLIATETLTGCGVITTRGGGNIAFVNGQPLARACGTGPTIGIQMGMAASATMGCLSGLETLLIEPAWLVLGSPTRTPLGGPVQVDVGTNLPLPGVLLGFGLATLPVSPSVSFAPWSPGNLCFPELYPTILPNPMFGVPMAAGAGNARFGTWGIPASPVIPQGVLMQACGVTAAGIQLSTPITLH
jgi:hypothetical protein